MIRTVEQAQVVVDASLVAMWMLAEPYSLSAHSLVVHWARTRTEVVAPTFMMAEVTNALHKRVRRGEIGLEYAKAALAALQHTDLRLEEHPDVHVLALGLAHQLGRPSSYDAHYLALAALYECEFWTGDERLYNAVRSQLPRVRWVGAYSLQPDRG